MKFQTAITNVQKDGTEIVRGHTLEDLIENKTFSEVVYLILQGRLPDERETRMFNALLTAVIDHGPATASALTARISASAKNSMHTALAAGILGFGDRHGIAVEDAMRFLYLHVDTADLATLIKDMKEHKQYVPGFGHKIFETDPRAKKLMDIAKQTGVFGMHCALSEKLCGHIAAISSKPLPLNVDGAMAAILCDMKFDAGLGKGVFMIGRVPGLIAQIFEESESGQGIRRLDENEVEYTGI